VFDPKASHPSPKISQKRLGVQIDTERSLFCTLSMPTPSQPRWLIRPPSAEVVAEFLRMQENVAVSYAEVGESRNGSPAGYELDHNRTQIGNGERDFVAACEALREWRMFPSPWTKISPARSPLREGTVVAMQAYALGLWWLNACRIIYLVNDPSPVRRFGFAYGTLPAHVEQGEERFSVELHPDGSVWYDIRAFSRPRYWPVRLAKPLARQLQRRFVRESLNAMREAVKRRSD
jgi:uncharacterized protein (UPF0548 family)